MFTKEERSSFSYWFAHWCAFQMTALNHRIWKPRYMFHDIEKPWLRLFFSYEKVQHWHRHHHRHHLEWLDDRLRECDGDVRKVLDKFDWKGMMIDWECSRFTKKSSPNNARRELYEWFGSKNNRDKWKNNYPSIYNWWNIVYSKCLYILNQYGFEK
jgi:hypothetical protein